MYAEGLKTVYWGSLKCCCLKWCLPSLKRWEQFFLFSSVYCVEIVQYDG